MMNHYRKTHWLFVLALVAGITTGATTTYGAETWLAAADEDAAIPPGDEGNGSGNPLPVKFGVEYTMVTDYVWRGLNLTEYAGEGREKLSHQVELRASATLKDLGLGDVGTVSVSAWFEFFVGNESQNARANSKLQEVDYTISWEYEIPDSPFTIGAGWIAYEFPHQPYTPATPDTAYSTYEVFVSVAMDDGFIYDEKEGVLNPSLTYFYDYDDVGGGFLIGKIKHKFALDEAVEGMPIVRDITLTPSASLIIDNRYWDGYFGTGHNSTKFSSVEIGLAAQYDVGRALQIPEEHGSINITVFTNFSHAFRRKVLNDEFYGGFNVGWDW